MFGGAGINLDLLRAIRLQVAVARAAVVEDNPTAKALLLLIRDGRLGEATADPALRTFLDQLCASGDDFELVTELYNGHLWTTDPATQQRNLLAAAVAHFEARKPLDKIASLAKASGATIQINIGTHQPFLVFGIAGALYFALCYPLSRLSRVLERKLNVGRRQPA